MNPASVASNLHYDWSPHDYYHLYFSDPLPGLPQGTPKLRRLRHRFFVSSYPRRTRSVKIFRQALLETKELSVLRYRLQEGYGGLMRYLRIQLNGFLTFLPGTFLESFTLAFYVGVIEQLRLQERP